LAVLGVGIDSERMGRPRRTGDDLPVFLRRSGCRVLVVRGREVLRGRGVGGLLLLVPYGLVTKGLELVAEAFVLLCVRCLVGRDLDLLEISSESGAIGAIRAVWLWCTHSLVFRLLLAVHTTIGTKVGLTGKNCSLGVAGVVDPPVADGAGTSGLPGVDPFAAPTTLSRTAGSDGRTAGRRIVGGGLRGRGRREWRIGRRRRIMRGREIMRERIMRGTYGGSRRDMREMRESGSIMRERGGLHLLPLRPIRLLELLRVERHQGRIGWYQGSTCSTLDEERE
jgi:hypothetical protein